MELLFPERRIQEIRLYDSELTLIHKQNQYQVRSLRLILSNTSKSTLYYHVKCRECSDFVNGYTILQTGCQLMREDSFDDLPKLIRYAPDKPSKPTKLQLKPLEISNDAMPSPKKNLDNILTKQPGTSEVFTPSSTNQQVKKIHVSDQELKKTEKSIKVERTQDRVNEQNKPLSPHKNIDRSKTLITQMVNKISAKNIAEELLPISNETINKMIDQIEKEKAELVEKATGYQMQLSSNPHNKNIQKQLESLEKGIQRFDTMKLLYLDKVQLRNENRRLLGTIEDLKIENKEVKAKVAQNIQQIEAHGHGLPCDKQKALAIEIKKCQEELKAQKEMRINLERNISNTIQNFTRLYEQADLARKIVVGQLKQIEVVKLKMKMEEDEASDVESIRSDRHQKKLKHQTKSRKHEEEARDDNRTVQKTQKLTPILQIDRIHKKPTEKQFRQYQEPHQKTQRKEYQQDKSSSSHRQVSSTQKKSLEDMVRKMRGNQQAFMGGER